MKYHCSIMGKVQVGIAVLVVGIIIAVSLLNAANTFCKGDAICYTGKVTKVVDGDTIHSIPYKIRLALVDTPEIGEVGYSEATDFTASLCPVGSVILVDQDDLQPFDKYDRMLGLVYCDGVNLSSELLENGHGVMMVQYCGTSEFADEAWAVKFGC